MSAVEKGSLILVTGANGFIASHIVDQLLKAGMKARGAVRSEEKAAWLEEYVNSTYGQDQLQIVVVPDTSIPSAYDEAVKAKEPKMRRFVYCSSSLAVCWPMPNVKFDITDKTYNESAVQLAWAPPPYTPERSGAVYGASKVQGEQALYKYAAENNLPFVVNSVVPNANLGPLLAPDKQTTLSAQWIIDLFEKGTPPQIPKGHVLPPQHCVDVRDTARLHVAALIDPDVKGERLFAMARPFTWKQIVEILKRIRPKHSWPDDVADMGEDCSIVTGKERAAEVLRKNFNVSGFSNLEETLAANIQHLED